MSSEFKYRLRSLRQNARLTQKELAAKLGVAHGNVSKYELGETFPPMDTIINIATFFEVSTDYLLGQSDSPGRDGGAFDYICILGSDGTRKMISIPPEKRERVIAMLSAGFPELIEE